MTDIVVSQAAGVVEITLDRPAKKNALTFAMYERLGEALRAADADASVRVVLLSASGSTFCAGNDIGDFLAAGPMDAETAPPIRFLDALAGLTKPIVAAVNGLAVGVGATMLLHCDLVYGSAEARLSMPFVSLGLVPEAASSLLLPQRVGHVLASEMLLLGTILDARRAVALGLMNEIVDGDLVAFARKKAEEIAAKPPRAVRTTKALLRGDHAAVKARMHEEGRLFAESMTTPEAREAFTAFMERRPADFSRC